MDWILTIIGIPIAIYCFYQWEKKGDKKRLAERSIRANQYYDEHLKIERANLVEALKDLEDKDSWSLKEDTAQRIKDTKKHIKRIETTKDQFMDLTERFEDSEQELLEINEYWWQYVMAIHSMTSNPNESMLSDEDVTTMGQVERIFARRLQNGDA